MLATAWPEMRLRRTCGWWWARRVNCRHRLSGNCHSGRPVVSAPAAADAQPGRCIRNSPHSGRRVPLGVGCCAGPAGSRWSRPCAVRGLLEVAQALAAASVASAPAQGVHAPDGLGGGVSPWPLVGGGGCGWCAVGAMGQSICGSRAAVAPHAVPGSGCESGGKCAGRATGMNCSGMRRASHAPYPRRAAPHAQRSCPGRRGMAVGTAAATGGVWFGCDAVRAIGAGTEGTGCE